MTALPSRDILDGTANPTTSQMKGALGQLHDYLVEESDSVDSRTGTASSIGFRNRIINGDMRIVQRAISATVTAGTAVPTASTGYPAVDRFFVYSTGANVTAARVAGSGSTQHRMQITGASGVTAIGVGQRIELLNSYDLAGGNATLSVDLANSLLTTVTWTASYATTADTFGTIGTPTKTQIATGTFTVNSTVTNYTAPIAIPAAATTGIEILLTVGAQTSGTWTIGNMQLEAGSVATPFERRDYGRELMMCQRYLPAFAGTVNWFGFGVGTSSTAAVCTAHLPVTARVAPTGVVVSSAAHFNVTDGYVLSSPATAVTFNSSGTSSALLQVATAGGITVARPTTLAANSASAILYFTGCEL